MRPCLPAPLTRLKSPPVSRALVIVALLLGVPSPSLASGEGTDGGVAPVAGVPFYSPDAGIFPVSWAVSSIDGGLLGPGWWLSDDRMTRIGDHIVIVENERDLALAAQQSKACYIEALLIGLGVGIVTGAGFVFYLDHRSK